MLLFFYNSVKDGAQLFNMILYQVKGTFSINANVRQHRCDSSLCLKMVCSDKNWSISFGHVALCPDKHQLCGVNLQTISHSFAAVFVLGVFFCFLFFTTSAQNLIQQHQCAK